MTTIYLVRHAEAEGNLYRRIHGWYDALITDNGFRQIEALEERFRNIHIDAVWSSDLYRTMTTARAVYLPRNLELHTDPGLRELGMGEWEDKTWGEVRHFQPEELDRFNNTDPDWKVEQSESFDHLGERVEATVRRLARQHPGQTIALFSHGMAIRQLLGRLRGVPPEEWRSMPHGDNTSVSCLTWDGEQLAIAMEQDNSHLPEDISTLARQAWWRNAGKAEDINLWYRPIDWEGERELYLEARRDTWVTVHGPDIPFDGAGLLRDAEAHLARTPWGVTLAFAGDKLAGILQLDPERYKEDGAGYIPFFCVMPEQRGRSLGIQLIGQAVSFYRPMGRDKLRLRRAPYNEHARRFCQTHGFVKTGGGSNSRAPLEILEKYIGYQR